MNIHNLDGCAPAPLAHYLKALGILRLVAEQVDPDARGWWEGHHFRLATNLDRSALENFFIANYKPTPVFNPWGARSGFYPGGSEKSARTALEAILKTTDSRFETYKETVLMIKRVIGEVTQGVKPENDVKDRLILALKREIRGKAPLWMDAVTALIGSGETLGIEQPALLGTGGNEGSGSYTSAYMAAIVECLLSHTWDHALSRVLYGENQNPDCVWKQSVGQFAPEAPVAPWDLLFAFEGACVARSAISCRNTTDSTRWMASPFFVAPASYGYPSESRMDEYAMKNGTPLPGRGEQWFPLWAQPITYGELSQIFNEGRATTKRGIAKDGWSMARAIASFGVRSGISEFIRFGYQQRNNMATHFAVFLGRFRVPKSASPKMVCLDDLDTWLPKLKRESRKKTSPARMEIADRRLSDALFAVTQHSDEPRRWQAVLLALADTESVMRTGIGFRAGVIPPLRPEWVEAANDDSPEFRLAVAFALQSPNDPVRRHWLPLKERQARFASSGAGSQAVLERRPEVVMGGRSGMDDAIAVVLRRIRCVEKTSDDGFSLVPERGASAAPSDLALLLAGRVNFDLTVKLARALMALDRRQWRVNTRPLDKSPDDAYPDDAWLTIRLSLSGYPLPPEDRRVPLDPGIVRRLQNGDAASAFKIALQRLRSVGIRGSVRFAAVSPKTARLWAAALAFPVDKIIATGFIRRLTTTH